MLNSGNKVIFYSFVAFILLIISTSLIIKQVNPVREHSSLTTRDGGIEPPSLRNNLYHRQKSVAFSNGVNLFAVASKEALSENRIEIGEKMKQEAKLSKEIAPQAGFIAPDFTFPDMNGKSISLSQFRGKVVFLNIWATWCGPCRIEMPAMEKLYQKFKKDDFVILAVSIDRQGKSVVKPFLKELGITFPTLLSPDGLIQKIYMVRALPTSFIIDKSGQITARVTGARDWFGDETIETFEHLISEK